MRTTFRSLMESGKRFLGVYLMFSSDVVIEVMKQAGVDFVILDMEHERLTPSEISHLMYVCDAVGMAAMVRVPGLDETLIKKALDMGASAIKIPGISNAEEARRAVALAKYPPEGVRGSCPNVRGNAYSLDPVNCYAQANKEIVVSVIVEGIEGVKNLEEIVATPGIDTISIGNVDLAAALGIPGQTYHPLVKQAVKDASALCVKYGKCCSAQAASTEQALQFADCPGITHFHIPAPAGTLRNAYKTICENLHKADQ